MSSNEKNRIRQLQRKYRRLEQLSSAFYLATAKWAKGKAVPAPVGRAAADLAQFLVKR